MFFVSSENYYRVSQKQLASARTKLYSHRKFKKMTVMVTTEMDIGIDVQAMILSFIT